MNDYFALQVTSNSEICAAGTEKCLYQYRGEDGRK